MKNENYHAEAKFHVGANKNRNINRNRKLTRLKTFFNSVPTHPLNLSYNHKQTFPID